MQQERRKINREIIQLPLNEVFPQECSKAILTNLSTEGLCYQKPFFRLNEKGSTVTVSLKHGSFLASHHITGKIVHQYIWGDKLVTGIIFSDLPDVTKECIDQLVKTMNIGR